MSDTIQNYKDAFIKRMNDSEAVAILSGASGALMAMKHMHTEDDKMDVWDLLAAWTVGAMHMLKYGEDREGNELTTAEALYLYTAMAMYNYSLGGNWREHLEKGFSLLEEHYGEETVKELLDVKTDD